MTGRYRLRATLTGLATASCLATTPLAVQATEKPGEGVTISMAKPTWDTDWFQAEVYKAMLRELGYDFSRTMALDNAAFYQALVNGDIDMWVSMWEPNHLTYEDTYGDGAEIVGYVAKGQAPQGYLVSKAHAEKYDIQYLSDFKRDDVKEAFDTNGDGKADLVACPPGWGCEKTIAHHLDAYDLRDHITPRKANYSAGMADALGRYKNGEPVFFYTWTPNWTVGLMAPGEDVVWIGVKETKHPSGLSADQTTIAGLESCTVDPCNLGWGVSAIRPIANSEFLDANPAVEALLKEARIPLGDISSQNARMFNGEDGQEDLERHAQEWVAENREAVNGWLETARAAAE